MVGKSFLSLILLEVCVLNAYILQRFVCEKHKLHGHAKRDLLAFKIDPAEKLIAGFSDQEGNVVVFQQIWLI